MDTLKIIVISAAAAGIVSFGVASMIGGNTTVLPVRSEGGRSLGAVSSPDIQSNYLSVGGVQRQYARTTALTQSTSSVICSLQAPAATSSLVTSGLLLSTATDTGYTVHIGKSAKPYTVGTEYASSSYGANVQSLTEVRPTSTPLIFPPNYYLVVDMTRGGGTGTFTPAGACQATWEVY